jgi:two-component system nitrogen regulation response regulator GlnG
MQEVFRQIALVSGSEACVHIHGESGTGKELVARAIHRYSPREKGPFIPVNLAALNPALAESELFGHAKGAFTGAETTRRGFFDQAAGGTVFLDEVADIPMSLQVKLLRALEEHEIWPVGADQPHHVDFRLISATNQDLLEAVRAGRFRHDLYYRLVTFQLDLPPLRERAGDLPELARHFCRQVAPRRGQLEFSREFLSALEERPWHGNVRELRNAIEHALIMSPVVSPAAWHLPAPMAPLKVATGLGSPVIRQDSPQTKTAVDDHEKQEADPLAQAVRQWAKLRTQEMKWLAAQEGEAGSTTEMGGLHARFLASVEAELFSTVLGHCRQNMSEAARLLGIHRTTLKRKLEEYGLMADDV